MANLGTDGKTKITIEGLKNTEKLKAVEDQRLGDKSCEEVVQIQKRGGRNVESILHEDRESGKDYLEEDEAAVFI